MPHFTWDISFGQVLVSVPIFWVLYFLMKIFHMMLRFRIEHEILMTDWAGRQSPPVILANLPTRLSKWW